jgi:hypothetical protein
MDLEAMFHAAVDKYAEAHKPFWNPSEFPEALARVFFSEGAVAMAERIQRRGNIQEILSEIGEEK